MFGADEICQAYIESGGFMAKLPVEDGTRGVKTLQSDGGSSFPEGVLDFLGKIAWGSYIPMCN